MLRFVFVCVCVLGGRKIEFKGKNEAQNHGNRPVLVQSYSPGTVI